MIISRFPQYLKRAIFEFSGAHELVYENIVVDGDTFAMYRLTGSGVLTISDQAVQAEGWLCGGGAGGNNQYGQWTADDDYLRYPGGGGGGGYLKYVTFAPGEYTVTIGAGGAADANGGKTEILSGTTVYRSADGGKHGSQWHYGGDGGSGGGGIIFEYESGGTGSGRAGTGAGTTTYPFGITDLKAHCAGGGSGAIGNPSPYYYAGAGGTNGGNGGYNTYVGSGYAAGGDYGGGRGAGSSVSSTAATFYGGGGGGGSTTNNFYGKAGYQGCIYVLVRAA